MSKGKGTSLRSIELETFKWELLTHFLLITYLGRDDFWGSMKTFFMLAIVYINVTHHRHFTFVYLFGDN